MLISIKPGKSGFAQYATERPEEAFTIIEGNPRFMEKEALRILNESDRRTVSNYSYVLSFKEENLTKEQLYTYYEQFKNMFFKNYDPRELSLLSVIHWDDVKPHIHIYVLTNSALTNRDLRQYRGYYDFKRVEAVQELINYQNNLASPFDNSKLFTLTQSQKKRDWLYKKHGTYEEVFDDTVERVIQDAILKCQNFKDFLLILKNHFGEIEHIDATKLSDKIYSYEQLIGKEALVFKDKKIAKGKGFYRYESRLFNERLFNKNLTVLKRSLQKHNLKDLTFSSKRKHSEDEYKKIFESTTNKQKEHLYERKVGKDFVNIDLEKRRISDLKLFKSMKLQDFFVKSDMLETFEKHLDLCSTKEHIFEFLKAINISSYDTTSGISILYIGGESFPLYNSLLYEVLKNEVNIKDEENLFTNALSDLSKNSNKTYIRKKILELFYEKKILTTEELETFFLEYGLKIKRYGTDKKKGEYITLENETGSVSIYDKFLFDIVKGDIPTHNYEDKKKNSIKEELAKAFLKSYSLSLAAEMYGSKNYINSINDYKLLNSPLLEYSLETTENAEILHIKRGNDWEDIIDYGKQVYVNKSLDEVRSGYSVADMFYLKGSQNLRVRYGNEKFTSALIQRIRDKGYPIKLYDAANNLIFDNSSLREEVHAQKVAKLANKVEEGISFFNNKEGISLSSILVALGTNACKTRKDIEQIRALLSYAGSLDPQILSAICESTGIYYQRIGRDREKGGYATFSFKDKKISVYDENIFDIYKDKNKYFEKQKERFVSNEGRLLQALRKEALRDLDEILYIKKPIDAFAQEKISNKPVITTGEGEEIRTPDVYYSNYKQRFDIHTIGDYSKAAMEIVTQALKNEWNAIMVSDAKLLEEVRRYVDETSQPIVVYNQLGERETNIFVNTLE